MDLAEELRTQIRLYVQGKQPLRQLRSWLEKRAQETAQSEDPQVRRLDGIAWLLMAELDKGHRDEESLLAELAGAMAAVYLEPVGWEPLAGNLASTVGLRIVEGFEPQTYHFSPSEVPVVISGLRPDEEPASALRPA